VGLSLTTPLVAPGISVEGLRHLYTPTLRHVDMRRPLDSANLCIKFLVREIEAVSGLNHTAFLLSADHQPEKEAKQAYRLDVGIHNADWNWTKLVMRAKYAQDATIAVKYYLHPAVCFLAYLPCGFLPPDGRIAAYVYRVIVVVYRCLVKEAAVNR
jgi:hypothetical protein